MFYVLNSTNHTFAAYDAPMEVENAIKGVPIELWGNLEIIDCPEPRVSVTQYRFDVHQFRRYFAEDIERGE